MSPNAGGGGGLRGLSQWVQLYTGAQRNFGDLTPYLTDVLHCKGTIPKIRNKYSQERNFAATAPIPTFMFLWAIYIFLLSVCLFCWRKIGGPNVGIIRSLTEIGTEAAQFLPFLWIPKSKFLCSVQIQRLQRSVEAIVAAGWPTPPCQFKPIMKGEEYKGGDTGILMPLSG